MFETVLVADRGATAFRVVRTSQRLGARTVVVHASDDGGAPAVRAADEAVPLGGEGWADSYGDPRRVLEAARRTGAEAVHPGAGWLAGDPVLARGVVEEGLAWLGVAPEALERTPEHLAQLLGQLGLRPAGPASGRAVVATVLEDGDGARVLGLREQVSLDGALAVDVAPADLAPAVRERCEHAALALARAAGAGPLTAVGLAVGDDDVAVTGVLPPLLVGASATEAASGLDLVEVGLCLAAGDPLPAPGEPASALALHLRAVDRFAGRLRRWALPADDPDGTDALRVDAAVREGDRLLVGSDRTLAVLTVRGRDAGDAADRARDALDAVVVEGLLTSLPALRALLAR